MTMDERRQPVYIKDPDFQSLKVAVSALQGRMNIVEEFDLRLRTLEVKQGELNSLIARNSEILDDIRRYLNKPMNIPAWIGACIAVLGLVGGILYTAYIAPLENEVTRLTALVDQRTYLIEDYLKHKKERN